MNDKKTLATIQFPPLADGANPLITTLLGPIPERDLEILIIPQESDSSHWCIAIEGRYKGADPKYAEHVGVLVRRDVLVSIKHGQVMTGEQGV